LLGLQPDGKMTKTIVLNRFLERVSSQTPRSTAPFCIDKETSMDPEIKSEVNALSTSLNAQVDSYKSQLNDPSSGILDRLEGTTRGLSDDAPGMKDLSEGIGSILESGPFSESGKDIAGSILPELLGGAAEGFVGQWVMIVGVLLLLWVARLIFISFVGSIDYRGIISLGNPGGVAYLLIALGIFGLAGYYGYAVEKAKNEPTHHVTTKYKTHFR